MERAPKRTRTRRAVAGLLALAIVGLTGCVGASPSGSSAAAAAASPSQARTASILPSIVATQSLERIWQVPSESASASIVPATPVNTQVPLPDVTAAPSGHWTSIHWAPLGLIPQWAPADPTPAYAPTFKVFGWSHGYVGFTSYPNLEIYPNPTDTDGPPDETIVSSYSSDGVHWHKGQTLDVSTGQLWGLEIVHAVIEGPAGLLAVGLAGGCASYWVEGLWTSTDGVSWRPVDTRKAFGDTLVLNVSGGPAGYVAVSYGGAAVWTSVDGLAWHPVALDAPPFVDSKIDDGTTFAGGYVLAGTTGTRDCAAPWGAQPAHPVRSASVWWSADSASWTQIPLPGATASSKQQWTWICRLSDVALLLVNDIEGVGRSAWKSSNGLEWTSARIPADIGRSQVLTDGHRGLVVQLQHGPASISAFAGDLQLSELRQNGEVPNLGTAVFERYFDDQSGFAALGPTGVVVTDGKQLWIGTPSAD